MIQAGILAIVVVGLVALLVWGLSLGAIGRVVLAVIFLNIGGLLVMPRTDRDSSALIMESEMRRLAELQEAHLLAHGRYAADLDSLGFRPSSPWMTVDIVDVPAADDGWAAVATHRDWHERSCVVARGAVTVAPRTARDRRTSVDGVPACDLAGKPEPGSRLMFGAFLAAGLLLLLPVRVRSGIVRLALRGEHPFRGGG